MIKLSVTKTYTVLVGMVMVLLLGVISFTSLKTDLLPAIELPYVVVMTAYPGASPEKVETSVTKPLETQLSTTNGLTNVTSISQENVSLVILQFADGTNMDSALIEMSNNIDRVKGSFDAMVATPTMIKLDPNMLPIMMASIDVTGMDIEEVSKYATTTIIPAIERVNGVASLSPSGVINKQLKVSLNQVKIDQVNDDILKAVDNKLWKAKNKINGGLNSLKDAQKKLEAQKNTFYQQLSDASVRLNLALATYSTYQADVAKYTTIVALCQNQMAEIIIDYLGNASGNIVDITHSPEGDYIAKMILDNVLTSSDTYAVATGKLNGTIATNNMILQMMGYENNPGFSFANDLVSQLKNAQLDLKNAKTLSDNYKTISEDLQKKYTDLEAQRMNIVQQFTAGQVKISSAQDTLNKAINDFNDARDKALKSANIDSLVTPTIISSILKAQNFSMPAGYLGLDNDKYIVKVGDEFSGIDQVEQLLLIDMGIKGVDPIYLSDVADITLGDNRADSYARVNGNDALIMTIQKSSVASTNEVTQAVTKRFQQLMKADENLHITTFMDQGIYIKLITDSVMGNLGWGALIALIVLWLFLKDIKPTLIIGISIPMSLLFAIVLMYFSNVSLNIISLSGLALGVGMLVDNSIVVIENIYRLRSQGVGIYKAAVQGASQVAGAITASTLTTICVFLPIVFTQGISRQLFTDMGLTIGYSLIASLVVAVTVVPALSSLLLTNTKEKEHKWFDWLVNQYQKLLAKCLNHKWIIITLTIALLGVSIFAALNMPTSFIPSMDSPQISVSVEMKETLTDIQAQDIAEQTAAKIAEIEDIETVAIIGQTNGGGMMALRSSIAGGSNYQLMNIYIMLKENKKHTNLEIEQLIIQKTKDINAAVVVSTSNMNIAALGGSGITINIKGNNLDQLQIIANDIGNIVKKVNGVDTVTDGNEDQQTESRVIVDKTKAMEYGLSVAQVYQQVATYLTTSTNSTILTVQNDDIQVIIESPQTPSELGLPNLLIVGQGDDVKLNEIADIIQAHTPNSISRDNQSRIQTVTATIKKGHNINFVSKDLETALKKYQIADGYTYEITGENETIVNTMRDLILMILLAIAFVYLIMVAQFQSLASPFIVIFTIPLAFTGGIMALVLTGIELSVVSLLGFLILSGVVVNNGIVFVDYTNQLRLQGMDKREALLETGKARIRPILMTAFTTILAMSTMAIGVGLAGALSQAMSIVTIGGLLYATILTLFLVPTIYDLVQRKPLKNIEIELSK